MIVKPYCVFTFYNLKFIFFLVNTFNFITKCLKVIS